MNCKPLIPIVAVAACLACQPVRAQNAQLPIIVDGSVTPDQIPDSLAYQHFLSAVAAHPFPSSGEQGRQAAQLSPLGLSPADLQTLTTGLASFRTQLDGIESARASVTPGPAAPAQITALWTQASNLVATTLQSIRTSLTADGMNRLDQYVKTHVKAHIRIYGGTH